MAQPVSARATLEPAAGFPVLLSGPPSLARASSPSGFAPHPHAQMRPQKSGSAESPLFPQKFLHFEGEEVKDAIPVNYKQHVLPQQTEMATSLPGRGQPGSPCPCQGPHFFLGGWEGGIFLTIPPRIPLLLTAPSR